jgi:hypothetical protein
MTDHLDLFSWAVGFWEGHGSANVAGKPRKYLQIMAGDKGREPLDRLTEIFGGNVNGPYTTGSRYQWSLCGAGAWSFCDRILPYLSARRQEQVRESMARAVRKVGPPGRPRRLTGDQAQQMRIMRSQSGVTICSVGEHFGVSRGVVDDVINSKGAYK